MQTRRGEKRPKDAGSDVENSEGATNPPKKQRANASASGAAASLIGGKTVHTTFRSDVDSNQVLGGSDEDIQKTLAEDTLSDSEKSEGTLDIKKANSSMDDHVEEKLTSDPFFDTPPGSPEVGVLPSTMTLLKNTEAFPEQWACEPKPIKCDVLEMIIGIASDPLYAQSKTPYIAKPFRAMFKNAELPHLNGAAFQFYTGGDPRLSAYKLSVFDETRMDYYVKLSNFTSYKFLCNPAREDPTLYHVVSEKIRRDTDFIAKIGDQYPALFVSLVRTSNVSNLQELVELEKRSKKDNTVHWVRHLVAKFQTGDLERMQGFIGMLYNTRTLRANCMSNGSIRFITTPTLFGPNVSGSITDESSPSKNKYANMALGSSSARARFRAPSIVINRPVPVYDGRAELPEPLGASLLDPGQHLPQSEKELSGSKPALVGYTIKSKNDSATAGQAGTIDFVVNWVIDLEPDLDD